EIATRDDELAQQRAVVDDALRDQVPDFAAGVGVALPGAVDRHQLRAEHLVTLALEYARPDDDVDRAGLVFQRDEDRALRGLGALAMGDQAAGARGPPVRERAQRCGGRYPQPRQPRTQQRQRMAAHRDAQPAIVGDDLAALR